jgi:tetratricopeptide (TPR) repeat protein/predicted Ser/Thr protein kinase
MEPDTQTDLTSIAPPDDLERRRAIAAASRKLFGDGEAPYIGRYRVERRLGAGGMGEVFLAHDEQLERKLAVKRLLPGLVGERGQARLRAEARALAKLSHANVVQVYEVGEHEGHTFLAMEYIEGQTLAAYLAERARPWQAVLERFVAAGRGLAAAHRAGIVHRDFKPDNVLLGRDGSVRVADFGIAMLDVREDAAREPDVAHAGHRQSSIAGTIRYMSPEQLRGEVIHARSDQFSFCIALFEALWAQHPFGSHGTLAQRVAAFERDATPPPRRRQVPIGLWRIVRRGLAREPSQRWPHMDALLDTLQRFPARRRLRVAAFVGLPLLGLLGAGVALAQQHQRATVIAACEAEAEVMQASWNDEVAAELAEVFAAGERPYLQENWTRVYPLLATYAHEWQELRRSSCREATLEHTRSQASRERVAACLDDAHVTFASLIAVLTNADDHTLAVAGMAVSGLPVVDMCTDERWLAQFVQAEQDDAAEVMRVRARLAQARAYRLAGLGSEGLAESTAAQREAELLGWPPLLVEAGLVRGESFERVGDYTQARDMLASNFVDALAIGHDFVALRSAIALPRVMGTRLAQPERGLEWSAIAEALLDRLELRGTMHEASAADALANVQRKLGDDESALVSHRRTLALDEAVHGPTHPDVAISLLAIANILLQLEQVDEAELAYRRAQDIQVETLGPLHPDRTASIIGLGRVARARGQLDVALAAYREALQLDTQALGPDHIYLAETLELIADALVERGEPREAVAQLRRALAIVEAAPGDYAAHCEDLRRRIAALEPAQPDHR